MTDGVIKRVFSLGFPWETSDPFLFCVYHEDFYPAGNPDMGPDASLEGRNIGQDFTIRDGWRMYHGDKIPGFPAHPHRGFETVTVVRQGIVDHADSLGAAGRYSNGDTQWLTAGKGVQHSEMFPLVNDDRDNTLELFQIWLNLPRANKMVEPYFTMLWKESIPKLKLTDENGKRIDIEVIAGRIGDCIPPPPPPDSWASAPANEVAIWVIKMEPHARWLLPATDRGINRNLYLYKGSYIDVNSTRINSMKGIELQPDADAVLENGKNPSHLLLLQGKPINEQITHYGPFVMNTREELEAAFNDYHNTGFGDWPWPRSDQVFPRSKGRFARHADGHEEVK